MNYCYYVTRPFSQYRPRELVDQTRARSALPRGSRSSARSARLIQRARGYPGVNILVGVTSSYNMVRRDQIFGGPN